MLQKIKNYYLSFSVQQIIDEIKRLSKVKEFKHIKNKKFDILLCENYNGDVLYSGCYLTDTCAYSYILNPFISFYIIKIYSNPEEIFIIYEQPQSNSSSYYKYGNLIMNRLDEINMDIYKLFDRNDIVEDYLAVFQRIQTFFKYFFIGKNIKNFYYKNTRYGFYNKINQINTMKYIYDNQNNFIKNSKINFSIETSNSKKKNSSYIFEINSKLNLNNNDKQTKIEIFRYNTLNKNLSKYIPEKCYFDDYSLCGDSDLEKFIDFIQDERNREYINDMMCINSKYISKFDTYREKFINLNNLNFLKKTGATLEDYIVYLKFQDDYEGINIGNYYQSKIELIDIGNIRI